MAEARVELLDVSYDVNGKTLVSDISFSVGKGEFIGVIGPNGAGKSTLLRLIGGMLRPTSGTAKLMGRDTRGATPIELATLRSMMSGTIGEDVAYTARTVVETGRNPHRRRPGNSKDLDDSAVQKAMTVTQTSDMATRAYRTLSTGEQARVQIARILAQDAPVALLDEPTASLDIANTELTLATLSDGLTSDHTTICVFHDLSAAAFYTDRLALMSQGEVVADGAPSAVLDAELLSHIYRIPMIVVEHPSRRSPLVLPAQ